MLLNMMLLNVRLVTLWQCGQVKSSFETGTYPSGSICSTVNFSRLTLLRGFAPGKSIMLEHMACSHSADIYQVLLAD